MTAERAIYTNGVWTFFPNVTESEQTSQTAPEIPILATNALAMPQFKETPKDIERDIRFSKYESLNPRKLNVPLAELWGYLRAHPELSPARASVWWTKFDGRLAAPWTCLVVVLIAIPFGAASGGAICFSAWRAAFSSALDFLWSSSSASRSAPAVTCPRGWRPGCRTWFLAELDYC